MRISNVPLGRELLETTKEQIDPTSRIYIYIIISNNGITRSLEFRVLGKYRKYSIKNNPETDLWINKKD